MTEQPVLKAERGLIWRQQEDGGWHVVASCLAHAAGYEQDSYELARLMAAAPSITERLVAMTPGGSEFHDDPNRCLNYIERRMARVVEQVRKRKEAEEQRDELLRACERALPWLAKMIVDGGHEHTVNPSDCVRALEGLEAAIAKVKGE